MKLFNVEYTTGGNDGPSSEAFTATVGAGDEKSAKEIVMHMMKDKDPSITRVYELGEDVQC